VRHPPTGAWSGIPTLSLHHPPAPHDTLCTCHADGDDDQPSISGGSEPSDLAGMAARLDALMGGSAITGAELRDLVRTKWGRSFEIRLHRRGSKMYLQASGSACRP
jgi:hypothetical protein